MKQVQFNRTELIAAAWDFLWADNLRQRADRKEDSYRYSETYFLTASDVEAQARRFIREALEGKPQGSTGRAPGKGWDHIRVSGNLFNDVRDWLLHNPKLQQHNFGRGHISGMRFRPVGEPLSEAEKETLTKKERAAARREAGIEKPRHYSKHGYFGSPECVLEQRRKAGRRLYGFRRSKARTTNDIEEVTCPRCKKLLEQKSETGT